MLYVTLWLHGTQLSLAETTVRLRNAIHAVVRVAPIAIVLSSFGGVFVELCTNHQHYPADRSSRHEATPYKALA